MEWLLDLEEERKRMPSDFDALFNSVSKGIKKDPMASLHKAGDITIKSFVPFGVLTGLPLLDLRIGRPGWPAGRCVELYGFEASGKSTLALTAIAQAQRKGGSGIYIDTEKTWDEERAWDIGVDTENNFAVADADSVEAGFRLVQEIVKAKKEAGINKPLVVVIDSITGVSNEYMRDRIIGEERRIGDDARAIRTGMRMIVSDVAAAKINLFMVNHAISKVAATPYAKQSQAAGGHAIKLFSSVRCNLAHKGWIRHEEDKNLRIGQEVAIELEKLKGSRNKYPKMTANLMGDIGFDTKESLLEACIEAEIVEHKKGDKSYKFNEAEFPKRDWPQIIDQNGGVNKMYDYFIERCVQEGKLSPWGQGIVK